MAGFSVPQYTFFYNGQVAASGSVYVYQTGTTTLVTIYSDAGLTAPITNPSNLDQNGQASFYVSGTVNLKLVAFNGLNGTGILIETIDPVYPINSGSSSSTLPWAIAGGTADAITATYSPAISSLTDGLLLSFRALAANATATPTFSPNGLTPLTITENGGVALSPGNIANSLAEYIVRYNLANTRWELLNPNTTGTTGNGTLAITFATPGNLAVTYSSNTYNYYRIGNMVHFDINIVTSSFTFTTASGNLMITGFPFTISNTNAPYGALVWGGITKTGYTNMVLGGGSNTTTVNVFASGSGQAAANVTAADTPTAGTVLLRGSLTFRI